MPYEFDNYDAGAAQPQTHAAPEGRASTLAVALMRPCERASPRPPSAPRSDTRDDRQRAVAAYSRRPKGYSWPSDADPLDNRARGCSIHETLAADREGLFCVRKP